MGMCGDAHSPSDKGARHFICFCTIWILQAGAGGVRDQLCVASRNTVCALEVLWAEAPWKSESASKPHPTSFRLYAPVITLTWSHTINNKQTLDDLWISTSVCAVLNALKRALAVVCCFIGGPCTYDLSVFPNDRAARRFQLFWSCISQPHSVLLYLCKKGIKLLISTDMAKLLLSTPLNV